MDIKVYAEEEFLQLTRELEQIAMRYAEPLKRMTVALKTVRQSLHVLYGHILENPFRDKKEEISFFKEVKPRFYALYLFEQDLYYIAASLPRSDDESLKAYYRDELRFLQRTLKQHAFLYQYYKLGADELDDLYFLRGLENQSVLIPEVGEFDRSFATNGDYLFSRFRACEMMQDHLVNSLSNIGKQQERAAFIRPGRNSNPLKWTGEQINAVELGYAIWFSGQLNGGDVALADIMYWLAESLDVDLSRHTRRFEEIKSRKLLSPTRFLDQMRDAMRKHMDDLNGFDQPKRRKAVRVHKK